MGEKEWPDHVWLDVDTQQVANSRTKRSTEYRHGSEVAAEYQRGYAEGVKAALAAVRGRGAAIDNGTVTGKTVAAVVLESVDEAEKALVKT